MAELSAQEVFDRTVRHLRGMDRQSLRGHLCAYRGSRGRMCAVGVHLTDEEVKLPDSHALAINKDSLAMVGMTIDALASGTVADVADQGLLPERLMPHLVLLGNLQAIHDNGVLWKDGDGPSLGRMSERLVNTAKAHGLDMTTLNQEFAH